MRLHLAANRPLRKRSDLSLISFGESLDLKEATIIMIKKTGLKKDNGPISYVLSAEITLKAVAHHIFYKNTNIIYT